MKSTTSSAGLRPGSSGLLAGARAMCCDIATTSAIERAARRVDVREHHRCGPFRIACLQRAHDLEVMLGAALQVLGSVFLEGAHHERRLDQRGECPPEARARGRFLEPAMELAVEVRDALEMPRATFDRF